jgi:hypothetical protein
MLVPVFTVAENIVLGHEQSKRGILTLNEAKNKIKSIANGYQDKEEFEESTDLYTFVALLVVVYSGFINYPIVTFEALISNNDVHFFIKWSEELVTLKFYSSYLTKSIIIGMCAFLRNEHLMRQIPEYINKFLNFLLVLLNKQKTEESKTLKTALKKYYIKMQKIKKNMYSVALPKKNSKMTTKYFNFLANTVFFMTQ